MPLVIYNTLTGKKERFTSLSPKKVSMYVCGPTVYGRLHVGNFRGLVFFNLVRNWLKEKGYEVHFVYNYTDVDDKIIQRAKEEGMTCQDLTNKYIKNFEEDFQSLKIERPSHTPRVTEHMKNIIDFISILLKKKKAYEKNESVYYSVKDFPQYGALSNKKIHELIEREKNEDNKDKKSFLDFALWKNSKPHEPSWSSPWGRGRPGWHIECSTMIHSLLGESIDIHGGGIDLVFPHHENEKAQTEALTKKSFVRYWMHHNMIEFDHQKMSKSLDNVLLMRDFLKDHPAEIFKYLILSVHYRSVLNFNALSFENTLLSLSRIYSALTHSEQKKSQSEHPQPEHQRSAKAAPHPGKNIPSHLSQGESEQAFLLQLKKADQLITEALDDDFNTPEVMARIFEVVKLYNFLCRRSPLSKTPSSSKALYKKGGKQGEKKINLDTFHSLSLSDREKERVRSAFALWIRKWGKGMSLFQEPPREFLRSLDDLLLKKKGLKREEIEEKVKERLTMRKKKNFLKADEIRDHLVSLGISLQDLSSNKTIWEVSKHVEEDSVEEKTPLSKKS